MIVIVLYSLFGLSLDIVVEGIFLNVELSLEWIFLFPLTNNDNHYTVCRVIKLGNLLL
jgi:hypothetical protein